jgi:hypothetical protein
MLVICINWGFYKPRTISRYELRQLMGKIVIERFKVKISVIIGWKLNRCNMLCTAALCGLSLGLISVGVQAVRWYFTHWKTVIFIYYRIAKYICFINMNQLYVEYICFAWFEYFRVYSNISMIVSEYSIVCCMFWDEIVKCLAKYDLPAWYRKTIFTSQAKSIEHVA